MYTFIDVWHRRKGTRSTNEYVRTHSTEEYVRTYVRSSEGEDVEQEGDEKDEEEDKKEEKGEEEDHPVGLRLSAVRAPPRTQSQNAALKNSGPLPERQSQKFPFLYVRGVYRAGDLRCGLKIFVCSELLRAIQDGEGFVAENGALHLHVWNSRRRGRT